MSRFTPAFYVVSLLLSCNLSLCAVGLPVTMPFLTRYPAQVSMLVHKGASERLGAHDVGQLVDFLVQSPEAWTCPVDANDKNGGEGPDGAVAARNISFDIRSVLNGYHEEVEAIFSAAARARLKESMVSRDLGSLTRVAQSYFATSAGRDALARLMGMTFDRGDYELCALYADLWQTHPTVDFKIENGTAARAAYCYGGSGRLADLEALLPKLKSSQHRSDATRLRSSVLAWVEASKERRGMLRPKSFGQSDALKDLVDLSPENRHHLLTLLSLNSDLASVRKHLHHIRWPDGGEQTTCHQIAWIMMFKPNIAVDTVVSLLPYVRFDPQTAFDQLDQIAKAQSGTLRAEVFSRVAESPVFEIEKARMSSLREHEEAYSLNILQQLLRSHSKAEVRQNAFRELCVIMSSQPVLSADSEVFQAVSAVLQSEKQVDVFETIFFLHMRDLSEAQIKPLFSYFQDGLSSEARFPSSVRSTMAWVLSRKFGDDGLKALLSVMLNDGNTNAKLAVLAGLSGTEGAQESDLIDTIFLHALKDSDPKVSVGAMNALGLLADRGTGVFNKFLAQKHPLALYERVIAGESEMLWYYREKLDPVLLINLLQEARGRNKVIEEAALAILADQVKNDLQSSRRFEQLASHTASPLHWIGDAVLSRLRP